MIARTILTFASLVIFTAVATAQSATSFFDQSSHDFGSVPRGPMLIHYYKVTNSSAGTVHISGARVSCGCVSASPLQNTLKPGESTSIYATMDTRRFSGAKQVTIFVSFDQPRWEEVQLSISAYGRDDMTLGSDGLAFGSVSRGAIGNAKMTVTLRQTNWAVQSASSESAYVQPKVKQLRRNENEAVYEVSADLQPGLPIGKWVTEVVLNTNSPVSPQIRVPAIVEVTPSLSISPSTVTWGPTTVGEPSETKLMIRGTQPFKITEIQGTDASVSATDVSKDAKPVHIITVKFDPKQPGDLARKLRFVTDLPNEGIAEVALKGQAIKK
jgi:hypothetical protein